MNGLIFAPEHNTPGLFDASGVFQPEARNFRALNGGEVVLFDNEQPFEARRAQVLSAFLKLTEELDYVATFCHGWYNVHPGRVASGVQCGFELSSVGLFADVIKAHCRKDVTVCLYSCSTGEGSPEVYNALGGDGGFADALRDALCVRGLTKCQVFAHSSVGHATKNPYVRAFNGNDSPVGGHGGSWLVAPGSIQWRAWCHALNNTDLRFEFPFLTLEELHRKLGGT